MKEKLSFAIVMPAWNARAHLERSLPPLLAAPQAAEVIVVDPASTDGTGDFATALGARVIRLTVREGPAGARNAGVAAATADIVLFIDADCVMNADVPRRVLEAFTMEPRLVSLTGSYDDAPPERNAASLYMNLRHHFTHQHARREPGSFWAGCGAVRRDAFLACGGFDAVRYPRPMIEDIELVGRLKAQGISRLDPAIQVKHLKRWSLASVIRTDIVCRAWPWSRLILERGEMPDDLNLKLAQRVAAAVAPLTLFSVGLAAVLSWRFPVLLAVAAALAVLSVVLNWGLFAFFARRGGPFFALCGWLLHQLHLSYSAATFACCSIVHRVSRRRSNDA